MMTRPERIALLTRWLQLFLKMESANAKLIDLFDASPKSEVVQAMHDNHAALTELVAEKVGDKDGWLEWFLWENDAGRMGLKARAATWERPLKIETVEDLEAIISA